jgi:anti-sigma B factor antagonist
LSAEDLQIAVDAGASAVDVTVAGEIDLVSSTQLKRALDAVLERLPPPRLIRVDLTDVGFMDTSGVAVLLAVRARALALGSRLVVSSASPFLERLFEVTGIGRFLAEQASGD